MSDAGQVAPDAAETVINQIQEKIMDRVEEVEGAEEDIKNWNDFLEVALGRSTKGEEAMK